MRKTPRATPVTEPSDESRVLALAAHELRTPLSVVNGYARMLLEQGADRLTERQQRMLEGSQRACGVLVHIAQELDQLAALRKHGVTQPRSALAIFTLCKEVLESVARAEGSSMPLFLCSDVDRSACVHGNPESLRQAFSAVMTSMAKAQGTDQLECCAFTLTDGTGARAVIAVGPRGLSTARDTITGRRAAFDRWQGGAGLSLPIACAIIESHGGSVWSTDVEKNQAASVCALPLSVTGAAR